MLKRKFGKTNFEVSIVGFGGAPAAYLISDQDRTAKVLDDLLNAGVNLIDTAASYPGSEQFLGERFAHRRKDFVLVSKCGMTIPESSAPAWSAELVTATVDRALRLLKTDHLDVMLLHTCSLDVLKKGDAFGALVKARDAGKTRFIGYSGDNDAAAFAAEMPEVSVIETSINMCDQNNIDLVLPLTNKNDIGVLAKRPVANAAWKDIATQPGLYRNYAKTYTERLAKLGITPESVGFKSAGDNAWPEMALRFCLSIDGVHCAIIGTTNAANAAANLRYASVGPLDESIIRNLRDAFRKADPDRSWSGQT